MNESLFSALVESAKTNRKHFAQLKAVAVACQQYELASELRTLETETFPETEEVKKEKLRAKQVRHVLSMVNANAGEDVCWMIDAAISKLNEKGGSFSIEDASEIRYKASELFVTE